MEDDRRAAGIAHKHGLKVDTYVQSNTLMYETFFAEEEGGEGLGPARSTRETDPLTYDQQSYRYRPCFANPNYPN
jgi:hypothetical protein